MLLPLSKRINCLCVCFVHCYVCQYGNGYLFVQHMCEKENAWPKPAFRMPHIELYEWVDFRTDDLGKEDCVITGKLALKQAEILKEFITNFDFFAFLHYS